MTNILTKLEQGKLIYIVDNNVNNKDIKIKKLEELNIDRCGKANGDGSSCATQCLNTQYESVPPTPTSDRVCEPLTLCEEGEYESVSPVPGKTNRECKALTDCSGNQYETTAPTSTSDRVCSQLTVCSDNQYESKENTYTSDRECEALTVCNENEYESSPAIPGKTNRVCKEAEPEPEHAGGDENNEDAGGAAVVDHDTILNVVFGQECDVVSKVDSNCEGIGGYICPASCQARQPNATIYHKDDYCKEQDALLHAGYGVGCDYIANYHKNACEALNPLISLLCPVACNTQPNYCKADADADENNE